MTVRRSESLSDFDLLSIFNDFVLRQDVNDTDGSFKILVEVVEGEIPGIQRTLHSSTEIINILIRDDELEDEEVD